MSRRQAFTLVELLVVVAIIALLLSILLPSLGSARDQAHAVVCKAHLHDVYNGFLNYTMVSKDWLPGSPVTSGNHLQNLPPGRFDPAAVDTPGVPVQTWDWAGPVAETGLGLDLSSYEYRRIERTEFLRAGLFKCPKNNFLDKTFPDQVAQNGWPVVMQMNSYSTVREFFWLPAQPNVDNDPLRPRWFFGTYTPSNHAPKLTSIQRPAEKVLLGEGSRFWNGNRRDFDARFREGVAGEDAYGGAYSDAPPPSGHSKAYVNNIELKRCNLDNPFCNQPAKRDEYAYRHSAAGEPGMSIVLFDGHAEHISKRDALTRIDLWYPSESYIKEDEFSEGDEPKPEAAAVLTQRPVLVPGTNDAREPSYPIY